MNLPSSLPLAQTADQSVWLPAQYSHLAAEVDWIFWYVMWVSVISFVGIVGVMLYFVWKYPRKEGDHSVEVRGPTHSTSIEVTWTVLPMLIVAYMFWVGLEHYIVMATPPADAYTIDVKAQKWNWTFTYPSGMESDELHVPMGESIRLRMTSADVMHALFVPTLRVKRDILPGRLTYVWFRATRATGPVGVKPDAHDPQHIFCAEFCGTDHSTMASKLFVHETREDFDNWLATYGPEEAWPTDERGYWFYEKKGCKTCHNLFDDLSTGPGWQQTSELLAKGGMRQFADGTSEKVSQEYITRSIRVPRNQIVKGRDASMPVTRFTEEERTWIADFIAKLNDPSYRARLPEIKAKF